MARRKTIWHVTDPSGFEHALPTRAAARLYAKSHGGARSGYLSNEYEYRRDVVRLRVALGFTEQSFRALEITPHTQAQDVMARTLIAVWRQAYDARDYRSASVFRNAFAVHEDYVNGFGDTADYEAAMAKVYKYALDHDYVDETLAEQWWYRS